MNDEYLSVILARQLAMTDETWERMLQVGFVPERPISLEFFYLFGSKAEAEGLRDFLSGEVEYESVVHAHADEWKLSGRTTEGIVNIAVLREWVEWMVLAGFQFGGVFDGWGAAFSSDEQDLG